MGMNVRNEIGWLSARADAFSADQSDMCERVLRVEGRVDELEGSQIHGGVPAHILRQLDLLETRLTALSETVARNEKGVTVQLEAEAKRIFTLERQMANMRSALNSAGSV